MLPSISKKLTKFSCEICSFGCDVKQSYDRHLLTRKHLNTYTLLTKAYICDCGKTYKHRQSLNTHKLKCTVLKTPDQNINTYTIQSLDCPNTYTKGQELSPLTCTICQSVYQTISGLRKHQTLCTIKHQESLKLKIIDSLQEENSALRKQLASATSQGTYNINTNNSHNKTFNLQIFLNEDCKDAMNMTDFINSVTLQLSDLESVGELGYVEGISNIFLQKLNAMDVYKRPIHCTDIKRHTMHIKDQDQWQRDDEYRLFKQAIKRMSKKNSDLLLDWKAQRCSSSNHDKEQDKYMLLIIQSMGGGSHVNIDDSEVKIIKRIAKCIVLDKTT